MIELQYLVIFLLFQELHQTAVVYNVIQFHVKLQIKQRFRELAHYFLMYELQIRERRGLFSFADVLIVLTLSFDSII